MEAHVNTLIERLLSAKTKLLQEEISWIPNVKNHIEDMSPKLHIIATILEDAESQMMEKRVVKLWLKKLQDTAYDMEDVLEEWSTRILMQKTRITEISSSSSSSSKVTCLPPFKQFTSCFTAKQDGWRLDIASRIKSINGRLRSLFSEARELELGSRAVIYNTRINKFKSIPEVDESSVYGRDDDKNLLVSKILSSEEQYRVDVISIVGLVGLGKTTLAQLVFNDERVRENFNYRIWICVSDPFDEVRVAKGILECLGVDHGELNDLRDMHTSIERSLSEKKFLLVLDDVWDDRSNKWERLTVRLAVGAPGSKVLVTTRKEIVAKIMEPIPFNIFTPRLNIFKPLLNIFKPRLMSDSDCWSLISRIAFGKPKVDSISDELEGIGKEIAKKCKGLPLAAKLYGGLLSSKESVDEWKEVLNSEIWKLENVEVDLFPHLLFSYRELPSSLKCCFSYYAIFPKDFNIEVERLTAFWISHGYVRREVEMYNMEQISKKYFKSLAERSFFNESISGTANESVASMHDIMHAFAQFISGDEFLTITEDLKNDAARSSMRTSLNDKARHLYCSVAVNPSSVCDVPKLRTCYVTKVPRHVVLDILEHLKLVRSLILRDCDLKEVPEGIRKLIYLRLLDLSGNPLRELPEALCELINLQHLFLKCVNLYVLPQKIGKLTNLLFLEAYKLVLQQELEQVYKSITLRAVVQIWIESASYNLGCFEILNQFQGALEICFASDFNDVAGAKKAELSRTHIKELAFLFSYKEVSEGVIDALQPPPNLQLLHIKEFWGSKLPTWITSFDCLTELKVYGAAKVGYLPPLGILPSLVKLQINGFSALKFISREFIGITYCDDDNNMEIVTFPKLVEFEIINCNELREWEDLRLEEKDSIVAMPNLEILHIEMCPELQKLPHRLLHKASPKKWSILDSKLLLNFSFSDEGVADGGVIRVPPLISGVQFFKINNVFGSKFPTWITSLNYLKELEVICASNVESLPPLGQIPSLEKLVIIQFSALRVIGREIMGRIANPSCSDSRSPVGVFPELVELKIESCYKLKEFECLCPDGDDTIPVMPRLRFLTIKWCPKLKFLPHLLLKKASSMEELYISGCCKALSENLKKDTEHLKHIKEVKINGVGCSMQP